MAKCKMLMKYNLNKIFMNTKIIKNWKRFHSGIKSLLNYNEEKVYKYCCVVPYKYDNILSLERIYDEKYVHIFSENNVEIESNLQYLYKLLINSRTVEQIRLEIHNSYCAYENNFINDIKNVNWCAFIPFSNVFVEPQINIRSIKSRLYHTCMLKNIILNVIKRQQQLYIEKNGDQNIFLKKKKVDPSKLQPLKINVLFKYNELKMNINISNDLNKRIFVAYKNQHSLKSTIVASAIFKINIFKYINPKKKLYIIDPFCNDGTVLLEILSILWSIPRGSPSINYPILTFPIHSPSIFYNVLNEVYIGQNEHLNDVYFLGIDENIDQVNQAKENLKRFFETMPLDVNENASSFVSISSSENYERSGEYAKKSVAHTGSSGKNGEKSGESEERSGEFYECDKLINGEGKNFKRINNFSYKFNAISTKEMNEIFHHKIDSNLSHNMFLSKNVKFCSINFLKLNNITENCILITNILNKDKKTISKFEKLLMKSDILNAYVFSQEKYMEKTQLKFKLILRFVSNGQYVLFLQLFNKPRKKMYDDGEDD
ncbi:hypothetical protein MKS88_003320 [Plasmodium brasilianum]|uniref:Uncharacterized protein n=1 Tax=Plasmodium brasilianum TaxID=5824 RepID=A0ACB9Y919_PLABR|nr:hypothetical protein MKS88_003320 [Plasmodium brasilianum]